MGDIGGGLQAGASIADTAMTDATNVYMQQQAQQFNAQQAALGRQFSAQQQSNAQQFSAGEQLQAEQYNTQMSDTAVQRRSQDIQAAGFNPLLAVGQLGGASSPQMSAPSSPALGGPSASSPAPPQLQGFLQNAAQLNLATAQAANIRQDTNLKKANTGIAESQETLWASEATPEMVLKRQQVIAQNYDLDYAKASEVDAAVNIIRQASTQADLDTAFDRFRNSMASMDATTQRATLNQLIKMQNAVATQQAQEAANVTAAQSGLTGKAIAYAQAVLTPVATGAQAAHSGASALQKLIP